MDRLKFTQIMSAHLQEFYSCSAPNETYDFHIWMNSFIEFVYDKEEPKNANSESS